MYEKRIKVISKQAKPYDKPGDATIGVGGVKFDFTKTYRNQLFSYMIPQ